jgi:hypothetical protein
VIAGGAIVAAGMRIAWATATPRPSPVSVPGFPKVVLGSTKITMDGPALGAGYLLGLALILALVPLGWLVAGPRARIALAALALAVCGVIIWQTAATRSDLIPRAKKTALPQLSSADASIHISSGAGIPVTAAGAALAAASAILGGAAGSRAPKLRMPERPPENPA